MIIAAVLFLTGCGNNEKEQANQLIEAAKVHFEQGALDAARADIDSLRKQFPNVVEARKAALQLHQEIELKAAQDELAATDSLLQITNQELDALQNQVDQHKLTTTRIKRDSIRTQFETLGAKIRYIRQKQKEY